MAPTNQLHNGSSEESPILSELRAASVFLERMNWLRQAGMAFNGARDYYETLGYDRIITTRQYRDEYARGGIAKRIVECFPKATWRGGVELFEDEDPAVSTEFEKAWDAINTRLNIWTTLQRADILAGLSTYSTILLGAPGDLTDELPKGSHDKLVYLQPFFSGGGPGNIRNAQTSAFDVDCTITEFEADPASPRFGEPKFYQIRRTDIMSPTFMKPVHWSRIIHVAEGCLDDNVYGVPTLENVWNLLSDLLKVTGGGAEAFWLRANAGLQINVDKDTTLNADPTQATAELDRLKQQVEDYKHNITRVIRTRGVDINQLGSDVANFDNPAQAILTQIAGSKGIPMRILTGSERGELASTQDAANFNTQVQDRRTSYAGPMIVRRLVDRLVKYGYLPTPSQYDVSWPTIETMSDMEKAQGAKEWAATNATMGAPVYTVSEIREHWQNLSPLTEEQLAEMAPPAPPEPEVLPAADGGVAAGEGDLVALEHKLSTTQFNLPNELAKKFLAFEIDEDDLALKGREAKPHVTVKYGLHTQLPQNVRRVVSDYGPVSVEMGKTAIFAGPEYDVLYVEVESDDLVALNALLSEELKTTDTHPTYVPHACIAYLKPGRGEKYVGRDDFEGEAATFDEVQFSPADTLITLEDDELVRVLAAAIESGATEVVDAIVGVRRSEDVDLETLGGEVGQ